MLENAVVPTSLAVLLKKIGHLRTELKQLLMSTRKENMEAQNKPMDARFITEQSGNGIEPLKETLLITDKGAPKTRVFKNDQETVALLDGGSATNIISLKYLEDIGVKDIVECPTIFALADGSKKKAVGQVESISLEIQGIVRPVSAVVFDHNDYELLLGRPGLITFGVSTDWARQKWKMIRHGKELSLPIIYEKVKSKEIYVVGRMEKT